MLKIPNPDAKYIGDEPTCDALSPISTSYQVDLLGMLNWYNYNLDTKLAKQILVEYSKTHVPTHAKIVSTVKDDKINTTQAAVARIVMRGGVLSDKHQARLSGYIRSLASVETVPVQPRTPATKRPSIQDIMQEKISEYIGELEGVFDDMVINSATFDLYADMRSKQLSTSHVAPILNWAADKLAQIELYVTTDDVELLDAYSCFGSKTKAKQLIKAINQMVNDANRYGQFKKANRKPKTRRARPAIQQVAKLKYMKEFTELGIKSVLVVDIVGAEQVWVYNTATRKLAAYRTDSSSGIQVKGTTLQNYDPDASEQRTLRKPEDTIKAALSAGKVQLRKILTDQSTKSTPVNGRINEDCVILRVVK